LTLLFEEADYGFFLFHLGRANCRIAQCYLQQSDIEAATPHTERGLDFLARCDAQWQQGEIVTHRSVLFEGVTHNPRETAKRSKENWVAYELAQFDKLEPKITDAHFLALLGKYRPLADVTE